MAGGIWGSVLGLFTGGIDKTITALGDAIDKNVTSDAERLQLKNALEQIKATAQKDTQDFEVKLKEFEQKTMEATVADRTSARLRDVEYVKAGKRNKRQDILAYLSIIMLSACLAASLWLAINGDMSNPGIQAVFALLNIITGGVLKTVHDVYGYEFGGSYGSDTKNGTIDSVLQSILGRKREGDK